MLPHDEWLHIAQRLVVGRTTRVYHRRESRPNLVVGHSQGKYWAYCQACKEGGVQAKDHVRYTGVELPAEANSLVLPHDMQPVTGSIHEVPVWRFVVSKGLDPAMLHGAQFSASRMRLMLEFNEGWMGRDVTARSLQKWLTYGGQHYLYSPDRYFPEWRLVVVEDAFSMRKLEYVRTHSTVPHFDVACSLGTKIHSSLLLRAADLEGRCVVMYDGDTAGERGAVVAQRALRALGVRTRVALAPTGMDPKDMEITSIEAYLKEHFV